MSPLTATLGLEQALYRGGRTRAATRQAEATVLAARANLTATEQDVLLAVVTAYLDVLRDQAIVRLNRNNEQVLRCQLAATRDRFEVGEITRTDVAQAEARLSRATSDRIQAEGDVISARAALSQLIGVVPGGLEPPPPLSGVPASIEEAVAIAAVESPALLSSRHSERASQHAIDAAIGNLLPTISLRRRSQAKRGFLHPGFGHRECEHHRTGDDSALSGGPGRIGGAAIPQYQQPSAGSRSKRPAARYDSKWCRRGSG